MIITGRMDSMAKKKARESAGARIAKQNRSLIWVAPTTEEKAIIRIAAALADMSMSQFVLQAGLREAEIVLKKSGKS